MTQPEQPTEPTTSRSLSRICLVAIIAIALLVRVVGLSRVPPPLFRDEAEKGYNAYCLAKTGRDSEGRRLPLFINAFGTRTSAIYQYATTPFVALFGLEVWSVRLTAALVGVATVLLLFLLARALFDTPTALVAAAILAVSPWHVCFSRWAQQGIFLPLFFTAATWAVVRFRQGWRPGLLIAAAAIALAAYAYAVGRVLAPLFLLLLVFVARREIAQRKGWAVAAAFVLAILVAPTLWFVTHQSDAALARFRRLSIAQPGMTPPQVVGRFIVNYAKHFDPVYLVIRGDRELRHSPRGIGQIYAIELPFLLLGLYFLARRRDAATALLIGWIAISPIAASMTREGIPHALRSLAGVPAFALVEAVGLVEIFRRLSDKATRVSLITLLVCAELAFVAFFLFGYFVVYPGESAQAWQAGFDKALAYCRDGQADWRSPGGAEHEVWISESVGGLALPREVISPVEMLVAFYEKIPPEQFQESRLRQTPYRVVPWGTNLNLLLTQRARLPICAIVVAGEIAEELAEQMRISPFIPRHSATCVYRIPAAARNRNESRGGKPSDSTSGQERR